MKTIHVSTGSPYDIMIERGILDNCGEIIKKLSNAEKITIVTDTNVAPLYKWRVLSRRVAAPSIRCALRASCWPLPQQRLPVSATGGGRRCCPYRGEALAVLAK